MKSEFLLAFNEICQERGLPQDTVIEALKTALVSAYRRNANVSNVQEVAVDIDPRTGAPTIYAEKEVVDSIIDNRTEILLTEAKKQGFADVDYGDMVMAESTPRDFGRIAAQTAKQVILQRVREAERDQLYDDFASREGEIVNGTVQSISGQSLTIGLGRTEAILPKSQQVSAERYRAHDKIRVYVLEVRRTNRGPQIIVSRNHRNLLRRLLELEVPEIYNNQVDIKSIAREAGQRSKVAVMALQPGVDPVGACVGMRGVRIQSIVRELHDEKIDVIEWDNDQKNFIAKALSPARVASVFLEETPDNGKTAVVIVPDDQLSLAIGREGQNARLAAKLTGWRIDIKSLTEAAQDSLNLLGDPVADQEIVNNEELLSQVKYVLDKKANNRPVTAEDYLALGRLVRGVEGRIIAERAAEHEEVRKARSAIRKQIPAKAWDDDIIEFNLMHRTHNTLVENGVTTVGAALYQLELGDLSLLSLDGFGDKALEEVKKASKVYLEQLRAAEAEAARAAEEAGEVVEEPEIVAEAVVEVVQEDDEAEAAVEEEPMTMGEALEAYEALDDDDSSEDEDVAGQPEDELLVAAEEVVVDESVVAEVETEAEEAEVEADDEAIDDLNRSLVDLPSPEPVEKKEKRKRVVVVSASGGEDEGDDDDARRSRKGRELVYDENAGRVVTKRKRKGNRRRNEWEDYMDDYR